MPIKIVNSMVKYKDIESGEVFIWKHDPTAHNNYLIVYDVQIQDGDEVLGTFYKEKRAKEYAEWVERKIDRKRICDLNHVLYADKDGICNICGKPFNEDF